MPGYILHLTAAKMYLDSILNKNPDDPLCRDPQQQNDFYIGNLLPDSTKGYEAKAVSHFRDPAYRDRMMEWPHPGRFAGKYADRMNGANGAVYRGYLFHLYIDRCFFRDYIPRIVTFYDKSGRETGIRSEITEVLLKKSGERISPERYLSEEYYYGDYTRMNTRLSREYNLPAELKPGTDPGIEEADYSGIYHILEELERYRRIPECAADELKVFDLDELAAFLYSAVLLGGDTL